MQVVKCTERKRLKKKKGPQMDVEHKERQMAVTARLFHMKADHYQASEARLKDTEGSRKRKDHCDDLLIKDNQVR